MDGEYEFNSHALVIFGIIAIILVAVFFPYQVFEKPKVKNITPNFTPTMTPIIEYVYVTPTPENGIYYAGEYTSGVRKLGRYFSWLREDAIGYKDLHGHVKVYDYRIFKRVHIFDASEGKYYEKEATPGYKYMFIFVKFWIDDIGGDDTRMWIPNEDHFAIHYGSENYVPIKWEKQFRMREFENIANENDDYPIWYYSAFTKYSREEDYASTGGYYAEEQYWVKGGESNAIDGYIVFEIPERAKEEDLKIVGNMYAFGDSTWILKY